jgi:hypothetical protein
LARQPERIKVQQGIDERFLRGILTRDISPVEAVFDLVDNSIDGARNDLISRGKEAKDKFGLPVTYSGYRVSVRLRGSSITVTDNCHGFERSTLENNAFIIGRASKHPQGIGYFGVGLKRALLALGGDFILRTNRPDFAATLHLTAGDLSLRNEPLYAEGRSATSKVRTTISISNLQPGAAHDFAEGRDLQDVRSAFSRRYGLFIRKGLVIVVNGQRIDPFAPTVRQRGPIKAKRWRTQVAASRFSLKPGCTPGIVRPPKKTMIGR